VLLATIDIIAGVMIILLKIGFANENWLIFPMGDPPGESVYHGNGNGKPIGLIGTWLGSGLKASN